jgi:uncharacterized membrane protein YfcA
LLGIGGGALIIPYLNYQGVQAQKIPAISALCTMTVAVVGTVTCMITGYRELGLPNYCTGYVYWPAVLAVAMPSVLCAPWGTKMTYILPVRQLKYAFTAVLLLTAIHLLMP